MTNKEVFKEYGTEAWVIEQNLCFMLQDYWEKHCKDRFGSRLPENPVTFVKKFMKEETFCAVELAEKSKIDSAEGLVIQDAEFIELP